MSNSSFRKPAESTVSHEIILGGKAESTVEDHVECSSSTCDMSFDQSEDVPSLCSEAFEHRFVTSEAVMPDLTHKGTTYQLRNSLAEGQVHLKGSGEDWMYSRSWKPRYARLVLASIHGATAQGAVLLPLLLILRYKSSYNPSIIIVIDSSAVVAQTDMKDSAPRSAHRFNVTITRMNDGTRTFCAESSSARDSWVRWLRQARLLYNQNHGRGSALAGYSPLFFYPSQTFKELYKAGEVLGEGTFGGGVVRAKNKKTGKEYAVKKISRRALPLYGKLRLKDEVASLQVVGSSDHIVKLHGVVQEPKKSYLIMELMEGGELLDRIVAKGSYTEQEAQLVCSSLFEAVDFMHKRHIAHRDLKPENLLLVERNSDTKIKVADLGFAKRAISNCQYTTVCGSLGYAAPEVLKRGRYDKMCDMWSVGVILYILLAGYAPFEGNSIAELSPLVLGGCYEFDHEGWSAISDDAKELISSMLQVNPSARMSAEAALQSKWMVESCDKK